MCILWQGEADKDKITLFLCNNLQELFKSSKEKSSIEDYIEKCPILVIRIRFVNRFHEQRMFFVIRENI